MKVITIAIGILTVAALLAGGLWLLSQTYYVGLDEQTVAIYQGRPFSLGPLELSRVIEDSTLRAEDVPDLQRQVLEKGIPAVDRHDAGRIIDSLREIAGPPSAATDDGTSASETIE